MRGTTQILIGGLLAAAAYGLWLGRGDADAVHRVAAGPGEAVHIDLDFARGLHFFGSPHGGSLTVETHAEDDILIIVEGSGWGQSALDFEVHERAGTGLEVAAGVRIEGNLGGPLRWMLGGPEIDVEVYVPATQIVTATVKRTEAHISGLTTSVTVRSNKSDIEVDAIRGSVEIASNKGSLEISDVHGAVRATNGRGGISLTRINGPASVTTGRGEISIEELNGRVQAQTGRGPIHVRFTGQPSGSLVTGRGEITIEGSDGRSFDLRATTGRGAVELGSRISFEAVDPDTLSGLEDPHVASQLGQGTPPAVAAPYAASAVSASSASPSSSRRAQSLAGHVNGGGPLLKLETGRGSIRIED